MDYPVLLDRVKAVFIDFVIILILMSFFAYFLSFFSEVDDRVKMFISIVIFGLYDPVQTAFLGATLGQNIMRLKVRKEEDESKKLNIITALFRFVLKALLGWVSLLTVTSDSKKRALHDQFVGSIVLYK